MKIGNLVKTNIGQIIEYCNTKNHNEINLLLSVTYSKEVFNINYPFFIEVEKIDETDMKKQSRRYWGEIYFVRDKRVRATSQWFDSSTQLFIKYLESKDITIDKNIITKSDSKNLTVRVSTRENSRYKGYAIGNTQNYLIRNILSNLGKETFSAQDWLNTKEYFNNRCAYCDSETELLIEHAIPINKERLGEHRLGNIVPSCKKCNELKANKDYKEFLGNNTDAISRIEKYMESKNYIPLEDNEQLKKILTMAYKEVSSVAERYITIINELLIS